MYFKCKFNDAEFAVKEGLEMKIDYSKKESFKYLGSIIQKMKD